MKKKLIFLLVIIIIDFLGLYYLYKENKVKKTFEIDEINEAIIINTKKLEFEEFDFDQYFYLKNIKDYKYELIDQLKITYIDAQNISHTIYLPYILVEPIVEEPIKPSISEEKPKPTTLPENIIKPSIEPYFNGYHDINVALDSNMNDLVYLLMKDIQTNQNVSINYASVNLSSLGQYPVYYYVGSQTYTIFVNVQ